MKVTVCELSNTIGGLERDWQSLVCHVKSESSDLVLLPEMPFSPWVAWNKDFDKKTWEKSVAEHDEWMKRLPELAPAVVVGTRPNIKDGKRFNEGFAWEMETGYHSVHEKYYLPNEEGFREATWYERGNGEFAVYQTSKAKIGFLICTEMWFNFHARQYAAEGIDLLLCPRATPVSTVDKWIAGGRTAAIVSGAYCLSSNFGHSRGQGFDWGGAGWIIEPEEGNIMVLTSDQLPFVTMEIDLKAAENAKSTYPRYVKD